MITHLISKIGSAQTQAKDRVFVIFHNTQWHVYWNYYPVPNKHYGIKFYKIDRYAPYDCFAILGAIQLGVCEVAWKWKNIKERDL